MFTKHDNNDNVSSGGLFIRLVIRSVKMRKAYGQGHNVLKLPFVAQQQTSMSCV